MSGWLDNSCTRQGVIIIAATCFIILVANGLVEGVLAHSVSTELFFILALILPAFCLPAVCFPPDSPRQSPRPWLPPSRHAASWGESRTHAGTTEVRTSEESGLQYC